MFISEDDIAFAWNAVRRELHRTPVLRLPFLDAEGGSGWSAKLETRQIMGSFKTRGAVARLAANDVRACGHVVAASAGNHGLGVAFAAQRVGVKATIVVPQSAASNKKLRIAEMATLIEAGAGYDEAEAHARDLAERGGMIFVSPFDDPLVAAGNGATLARELIEDTPMCDAIICPVGGGGLIAGIARYLEETGRSDIALYGAQPESNCAMLQSLEQDTVLTTLAATPTLAEGLEGGVCARTVEIVRRRVRALVTVREESIGRAMAMVFRQAGEVLEGSGAVSIAALLEGKLPLHHGAPVLVLTGRNVDRSVLDGLLETHLGPRKELS